MSRSKEQDDYAQAVWDALHDNGAKADVDAAREALDQSSSYDPHGGSDSPSDDDDDYSPGSTIQNGTVTGFDYGNKVSSGAIVNYLNNNSGRMTDDAYTQAGDQLRDAILREINQTPEKPQLTNLPAASAQLGAKPQDALLRYQQEEAQQEAEELLKQQQAAQLAANLANLKTAYEKGLNGYQTDGDKLQAQYDQSVAGYENRRDRLRSAYDQNVAGYENSKSQLRANYEKAIAEYRDSRDRLGQIYGAARNRTAAQSAQGQRAFDERAAALGLGTGTTGQAALARGSVLQSNLAGIDQAEANAQADIDLQMRNLGTDLTQKESDIDLLIRNLGSQLSQQESDIDLQLSNLASQLGVSRSELDRAISDLAAQYELATAQAKADSDLAATRALYERLMQEDSYNRSAQQQADAWARQDQQQAETWARQDAQQAQTDARSRIDTFLKAGGALDQLSPDLIAQSGYTQTELNALESYYQTQTAAANTPTTILDTMRSLGSDEAAYSLLAQQGYTKDITANLWNYYLNGQTPAAVNPGTIVDSTPRRISYDNGGLTSNQVKQLQTYYGLTPDGYWGPNSQKTTGMTADQAWKAMQSKQTETPATPESGNWLSQHWLPYANATNTTPAVTSPSKLGSTAQRIYQTMVVNGRNSQTVADAIETALATGAITEAEADYLLRVGGV